MHSSTVDEQFVPYIVPGECGGKADTSWVALTDKRTSRGLLVISGDPTPSPGNTTFALVSALPFSAHSLASATHTSDLGMQSAFYPLRDKHNILTS